MTSSHRFVHVVEARHLGGHRVRLRFDDGLTADIDLAAEIVGEVFAPLVDVGYFARFRIDEGRTLSWPNGADFAPEFLHELASRSAVRATV
jgi:hypothetical protein